MQKTTFLLFAFCVFCCHKAFAMKKYEEKKKIENLSQDILVFEDTTKKQLSIKISRGRLSIEDRKKNISKETVIIVNRAIRKIDFLDKKPRTIFFVHAKFFMYKHKKTLEQIADHWNNTKSARSLVLFAPEEFFVTNYIAYLESINYNEYRTFTCAPTRCRKELCNNAYCNSYCTSCNKGLRKNNPKYRKTYSKIHSYIVIPKDFDNIYAPQTCHTVYSSRIKITPYRSSLVKYLVYIGQHEEKKEVKKYDHADIEACLGLALLCVLLACCTYGLNPY